MVEAGPLADERIALNAGDSGHFCPWYRVVMAMERAW